MNAASCNTVYAISGHIATVAYISDPISKAYGVLLLGVLLMEGSSFKWGSMGIATLFALFIPHFWRIELIYCACPIEIVLFSGSCSILMPTILEGSPILVILKRLCNSAFRCLIMSGMLVNSNRSSTHTVIVTHSVAKVFLGSAKTRQVILTKRPTSFWA